MLVTGASGGVGRGTAIACGRAGWTVWIAARRREQGEAVATEVDAAGGHGRFIECDVGQAQSIDASIHEIAEAGPLHGVVHNATSGYSPKPVDLAELPMENLRDQVAVGLRGMFLLATRVFPLLEATSGSFVVMTSEAGFEGKAKLGPYAAVKGAQRGLARVLAREWGPSGVRINCVAPLAMTPAMEIAFGSDPEMAPRLMGRNPLGRVGDAVEDVGPVVRFLLSPEARYVTGNTVMADGASCPIT